MLSGRLATVILKNIRRVTRTWTNKKTNMEILRMPGTKRSHKKHNKKTTAIFQKCTQKERHETYDTDEGNGREDKGKHIESNRIE